MNHHREITVPLLGLPQQSVVVRRRMKGENGWKLFQAKVDLGEYVYDVKVGKFHRIEKAEKRVHFNSETASTISIDEAKKSLGGDVDKAAEVGILDGLL